jgi:hypothetical protein
MLSPLAIAKPAMAQGEDIGEIVGLPGNKNLEKIKSGGDCKSDLTWYEAIVAGFSDLLVFIPKTLADWTTYIASLVISWIKNWPITNTKSGFTGGAKAFIAGWTSVRDLANMFIVLGFVIVGIATTLRIRDYEAKKALLPLIIIALLINFSGLLCGIIIDASNIAVSSLSGTSATTGVTIFDNIKNSEKDMACNELEKGNLMNYLIVNIEFLFIYLAVAVAFLYLVLILMARYVVLGILFMLSPLAFAFYAFPFPKAKDLWNKWWENFIKWAFIGVGIAFFLNLTSELLAAFPISQPEKNTLGNLFFYLTIVLLTLIIGIKITTKVSAMGSAAVMGLATGAMAYATGGASLLAKGLTKGGAKMADKATGNRVSSAGRTVSSAVGRGMERLGLKQTGTTATANTSRVNEEAKLMANEYSAAKTTGNTATVARIQSLAQNARGAKGAAAMKVVSDAKDLSDAFKDSSGKTNNTKMAARISYAESTGASGLREQEEKRNPNLKAFNEYAIDKKVKEKALPGAPPVTRANAAKQVVMDGFQRASISDIREFSADTLKSKEFIDNTPANKIAKAAPLMSAANVGAIKSHTSYLQSEIAKIKPSGAPPPTKRSPDYARYQELIGKLREIRII